MVARLSEWIELSFWQIAVRVLSGARPFGHGLQKVSNLVAAQPAFRVLSKGWIIACAGWVLGLVIGIIIAGWI